MSRVKTLALAGALLLLSLLVMPLAASAQMLRLEDPIRSQERWQRDFDRENARQSRDARDRERDEACGGLIMQPAKEPPHPAAKPT
jgi:hypothetical protein